MRQFERDDVERAAAGDLAAQLRVERRKWVMKWNSNKRSAAIALATPLWRNKKAIIAIYKEARRLSVLTGIKYEVDHVVPIQGRRVCGLHVEFNLQIISKIENNRKHSKYSEPGNIKQLERMGFKITSGMRGFNTALKSGPVLAIGEEGVCYRVFLEKDQLKCILIDTIKSQLTMSELIASESASAVIIVQILNSRCAT